MANQRYAPDFHVTIRDQAVPDPLRAVMSSVTFTTGLQGADRVEVAIANQALRWLDDPLLAIGGSFRLALGYAPDALVQMFVGEITGVAASFPSNGIPQLTLTAQDQRQRMKQGKQARWFARPAASANVLVSDQEVGQRLVDKYGLQADFEPIGSQLAGLIATATAAAVGADPDTSQRGVQKQIGQTDFDILGQLAKKNGWEVRVDYAGPDGGRLLHFFSPLDELTPELTLRYGESLIDFTPRESNVGQVTSVTTNVWVPGLKKRFGVTLRTDPGQPGLTLAIRPDPPPPDDPDTTVVLDEPLTPASAPSRLLSTLMPRLNEKLTGSGSTVGNPRIRAGVVMRLEGLGVRFGGLYRVTSTTHTIDASGYRTRFDVRKEIWFDLVPDDAQGKVQVRLPFKVQV